MVEQSEHRWTVRVEASDRQQAQAYLRKERLFVGPGVDFDIEAPRPCGIELLLAALASDVASGLKRLAWRRRLAIDAVEVVVHGELENALVVLEVVGEQGSPALRRVELRAYVTTALDRQTVTPLWEDALRLSALLCTLRPVCELELSFKVVL